MQLPLKIPGLKWITLIVGIYTAVWIALEGDLLRVVLLSLGITAVIIGQIIQKYFAGRKFNLWQWLLFMSALGLLLGAGTVLITLILMAVKTGLHAHGSEFALAEIQWVWQQLFLWSFVGMLAGLGVGLLMITADMDKNR